MRITNYSEAWGSSLFGLIVVVLFMGIGIPLLVAAIQSAYPVGIVIALIPVSLGLLFGYGSCTSDLVYTISLGERCDVVFVLQKKQSFDYHQFKSIHLTTKTVRRLSGLIVIRDSYINIEIKDGPAFRFRTNPAELEKIKALLHEKGQMEKFIPPQSIKKKPRAKWVDMLFGSR